MILKMTNAGGVSYTEIDHISFMKGKIVIHRATDRGDYHLQELVEFKRGEVTEPVTFDLYGRWGHEKAVIWKTKKTRKARKARKTRRGWWRRGK